MELKWPWLLVAVPVVIVVLVAWWSRAPRRRTEEGGTLLVAHASRLRALPRYAALVRRQTLLTGYRSLAVLVVCAGATLVAARPQSTQVLEPENASRDVMLCLDASGSMGPYNVEVVRQVRAIAADLEGERIGLTIFNGLGLRVFPLTDDYGFILDQLDLAQAALGAGDYDYTAGTDSRDGLSLLSDGLVTCAQGFDRAEDDRGRAIIVSSDNDPIGESVFTLGEATDYAAGRDIAVHVIASPETQEGRPRAEFERVATRTGGSFTVLGEDSGSTDVVDRIQALEERKIAEPPREIVREEPVAGSIVAGAGVLLLLLGWGVEVALTRRRPR